MSHSKFMAAIINDDFDDFDMIEYVKLTREEREERNGRSYVKTGEKKIQT
jgi:hypothetical protein